MYVDYRKKLLKIMYQNKLYILIFIVYFLIFKIILFISGLFIQSSILHSVNLHRVSALGIVVVKASVHRILTCARHR